MIEKALNRLRNADADLKEVIRGSAIAFGVNILAAGSAFAMNVVIARQLGANEAGLFFLAYTIVFAAASVTRLGLDNTFVRFIAAYHVTNDWGRINGLYKTGIRWTLVTSLGIAGLFLVLAEPLAVAIFHKPLFAEVIRAMALGIPLMALFTLYARALQGIKRIPESMTLLSVATPVAVLVLASIVRPERAEITGWLFVAATGATLVLGLYLWYRHAGSHTAAGDIDRGEILASCVPLLGVMVLNLTATWSSQIMLGAWADNDDVAVFNAAQRTAMLTSFVLVAVNSIAAPKFAAMFRAQQQDALRRTATNATRLMVLFAIIPLTILLSVPHLILSLFGSEFMIGSNALRILAIGQFVNVATGSVAFLLSMTGYEKLLRNNVFIAAAAALVLGLTLIPKHGILGAAVATACGVVLQNLLGVLQVRRIHGFNTLAIWK